MDKRKRYVALNLGSDRGEAVSGGFAGGRLLVEPLRQFPVEAVRMLGTSYWNFPALFANAQKGLAAHAARFGPELAGVGVSSWGGDFGLLDRTGHLLANPVERLYERSEGRSDRLRAAAFARLLYRRTGVRPGRGSALRRLRGMKLAGSPVLENAATLLPMADLLAYFLSGAPVGEYTLATTTGLYDSENRDWAGDLIKEAGISTGLLPLLVAPGTVIGPMLDAVAAECGLGQTPVIAPAGHGLAGAAASIPGMGDDSFFLVLGGRGCLGVEVPQPQVGDAAFVGGFDNVGGVDGGFLLVRDLPGLELLEACAGSWNRADGVERGLAEILELAEASQPLARLVNLDDPRLAGAADPPAALAERLIATGQPPAATRSDLVRLCLDSLVMAQMHGLRLLSAVTGRAYRTAHVAGRGAGLACLNQALANACGLPVRAGPEPVEAIGNLVMQALALGDIGSLDEAREVTAKSFAVSVFEPRRDDGLWTDAYGKFLRLI